MPDDTVIVVPGFLGSTIYEVPNFVGEGTIWVDPWRLFLGKFHRLRLAIPGEVRPADAGPELRGGVPLWAYYGVFSTYFLARGWRVVSPTGDWRTPLINDAYILAALVRTEAKRGRVQMLCHSRGGLVARMACEILRQSGDIAAVKSVITLGTPHTGSLNAVSTLGGWNSLQRDLATRSNFLPSFVSAHLGLTEVNDALRSWPGLYELLPRPGASWLKLPTPDVLYQPATYAAGPMNPPVTLLTAAKSWWAAIPDRVAGPLWVNVAGVGVWTANAIPDITKVNERGSFDGDENGDGTVPYPSATDGPWRKITVGCSHDRLVYDGRLAPVLHEVLTNGITADIAIPGAVNSVF